jgi:hypothetical protein
MRKVGTLVGVALVVMTLLACGGADIGESCDEEGRVGGECVDGAVCGKSEGQSTGSLVCLKQCTTQVDCGAGEDCNGVSGTNLKGCRPKK